jgi:uncharacterized membrane protein
MHFNHLNIVSVAAVRSARGLIGIMAFFGLVGAIVAIFAGVFMVFLGSIGNSEIRLFGQEISTTNVGVACVFLGIVALIVVVRRAFTTLEKAIAAPSEKDS